MRHAEIFSYKDIYNRGCHLWEQCQVIWEQFLGYRVFGNILHQAIPPLSDYMSDCYWYNFSLGWGHWDHGAELMVHLETIPRVFNKILSPCLWLSGKLPFNSSGKKYPSKPIQFLKLWPFKFMGPYYSYSFVFHIGIIQFRKGQVILWVLLSILAPSKDFIQPRITPNLENKC